MKSERMSRRRENPPSTGAGGAEIPRAQGNSACNDTPDHVLINPRNPGRSRTIRPKNMSPTNPIPISKQFTLQHYGHFE